MKKENHNVAVGVTIAAVAAAAAGAIFLYGKDGNKRRKKVSSWMLKAKGEILERMEKLKDVNEDAYKKIVDTVSEKYAKVKNVDPEEVAVLMSELKGHWNNIKKQLAGPAKKKAVKKTTPKK
jgi:hypothetical protein